MWLLSGNGPGEWTGQLRGATGIGYRETPPKLSSPPTSRVAIANRVVLRVALAGNTAIDSEVEREASEARGKGDGGDLDYLR